MPFCGGPTIFLSWGGAAGGYGFFFSWGHCVLWTYLYPLYSENFLLLCIVEGICTVIVFLYLIVLSGFFASIIFVFECSVMWVLGKWVFRCCVRWF